MEPFWNIKKKCNGNLVKLSRWFWVVIILVFFSCSSQDEPTQFSHLAPKVVPVKGYIVPKDSLAAPKAVLAGKPKVIKAGKPTVIPINTNIRPVRTPKVVMAGKPVSCTPGKNSFSLPQIKPALNRSVIAGIPEVVIAKEASSKDQNSHNFNTFTKLQGLKNNYLICLLEDMKGNIWFGTWGGGITRYDGKNFTTYTEKEGLSKNFITSILEDHSGNLWFGTYHGGASKYDGKNFRYFTTSEGLNSNDVNTILEDNSGNIWFGTNDGLAKYDGENFTIYTEKQGLINNNVRRVIQDKAGILWIGTIGGVSKFNGNTFSNYSKKQGLSNEVVESIGEDKSGNIWFGTNGSVIKFDGKTFITYAEEEGFSDKLVSSILEDNTGKIWFGTDGDGLYKFDGKNFIHFTEKEGLRSNFVNNILQDRSGTLWIGGDGLSKHQGDIFTFYTSKEGLTYDDVWNIFEDSKGNLWFGTAYGLSKYGGKSFLNYTQQEGLTGNFIWSTIEDREGNIWIGIEKGGILKFDGKTFTHYSTKEGLIYDDVRCLLEDQKGNLWIGTLSGGVSKCDGKTFTNYTEKEGLSHNDVYSIIEDKKGNIWFGTREGGVTKYDGNTFTHFTVKQGLPNNTSMSLIEDQLGNIWFGTFGGGITIYDGKTFTYLTEKEGLSNDFAWSLLQDKSGNLWLGTVYGLNELTPGALSELSSYANGSERAGSSSGLNNNQNKSSGKNLFKTYTYEDGFLGIGTNLNAILEDKNGTVWIGANSRLTAYFREGDKIDTISPNIQLTGVTLFNEKVPWVKDTSIVLSGGVRLGHLEFDSLSRWYNIPEHLSLPYNNNHLTFHFIGITTKAPQKVKYQYKLKGLDNNWSSLSSRTEAPYGNLPYGDYTFKVKAVNGDGYWSKEFDYTFSIRPPWWRTWWAYSFYGLCLLAGAFAVAGIQRRRLIAIERERARERELAQAQEIEKAYHELKQTQAQLVQREKMASLGELTAGIAHEIQNPLNFVNNFSEVNAELIQELHQEVEAQNKNEALEIAKDIRDDNQKIYEHGKRADSIVKGMLQHSRTSSGEKELTDINALAEEYLRLSYHGLRAKNKDFNANLITEFDNSLRKVEVVPQEIGRVLLNLFNNAFYATQQKKAQLNGQYQPEIKVTTCQQIGRVEIKVRDNGIGIPQSLKNKIFQPFFTTKPTGQGTGLGLSLSYDIITKAHGGELKVNSQEGEYSEFMIKLPG